MLMGAAAIVEEVQMSDRKGPVRATGRSTTHCSDACLLCAEDGVSPMFLGRSAATVNG